ncbi:MAG: hypothetical protein AB7O28_23505 [Vicinamibacterales bacterium]
MTGVAAWALAAVAARLAVSWASADAGVFADMTQYHERAVLLAHGAPLADALRGPGYPTLLALAYRLGGESFWWGRVANALVGGALAFATGWLARRAGAGARAWMAAAAAALYPSLVLSSVYLMPEGLYTLLVVAALVCLDHRSPGWIAAAGLLAGAAMLTRSVGLALLGSAVGVAAWAVVQEGATLRAAGTRVAVFVLAAAVVLTPWLLFTTRVAGGPMLDATSGINVLLGAHDTATGRLVLGDEPRLRAAFVDGSASPADGNRRALAAALAWARAHPARWGRLAVAKVAYLAGLEGREHAWAYGNGYFGPRSPLVVTAWGAALLVAFPILALAALAGLVGARVPGRPVHAAMAGFVVATCALHALSFGESRFHLPIVPLLAVAASLSVPGRVAARWRIVAATVVAAALVAAWTSQAGELVGALARLRTPAGWQSHPPY